MGSCKQLLNFLMELYNIMNLVYFFKSDDFSYLEIIPSLLQVKLVYLIWLRDQRPLLLSARLGFSEATITFRFFLEAKKEGKQEIAPPYVFISAFQNTFPIFPVCSSVQNFKAVETGCWSGKEGELCTFSRKISVRTNNMVLST